MNKLFTFFYLLSLVACGTSVPNQPISKNILIADTLLSEITRLYASSIPNLLSETYPINPDHKISYLANDVQTDVQRVAYLWPYSGMLSGVVALYEQTKNAKYIQLIDQSLLPGLAQYWDTVRQPACYQSYPSQFGQHDRFYDDNDWIAIDLVKLYLLTQKTSYLEQSKQLHRYIYSGWDQQLGGGIYWCEQKQTSKNTCSNAPAAVLSALLYQATQDHIYLQQAIETYAWTKKHLQDPADGIYWDNINLQGKVDSTKYSYNVGQMIQAACLLYQITQDKSYLVDAQFSASNAHKHYLQLRETLNGPTLFYPNMPWFNVILYRGYDALRKIDQQDLYTKSMQANVEYAWQHTRDQNGLLGTDWTGEKNAKFKWLLDNACMIEMFAMMSECD